MIVIIAYTATINKKIIENVVIIILSFLFFFIIDNLLHFIWNLLSIDYNKYFIIYASTVLLLFHFLSKFIIKKIVAIRNKFAIKFSKKIWIIIGIDLFLCLLIFAIHINLAEKAQYSRNIFIANIILYICYFAVTVSIIIEIVKTYDENKRILTKQSSYDDLQEYMRQIEDMYQNLRSFKHDYVNIMASMAGYIEEGDMKKLELFFNEKILPISITLNQNSDTLSKLYNISIIELKSLLSIKLNYAFELGIMVELEIFDEINEINMNIVDLCRIMGILLDNAIEAAAECKEPYICVCFIKSGNSVIIIIKNCYLKQNIPYSKLGDKNISSKGENHGVGLFNIKRLLKEYSNVLMDTAYEEQIFTQHLEIYD